MEQKIYIAFRFHGNFYHSYRGGTPDELGFGKDIRIIRRIIKTLDELNAQDIPVRGTWDFENYFSLEQIMPAHCPDIIAALQRRAVERKDEFQLMSYNNGLISAHSAREFEEAIRRGVTNSAGSGVKDLFGESFYPMVRPQEMMYTPVHLKLYRACGVSSISLYYSALPFNGFSSFIPPLAFAERYNPLTLAYPGIAETMTLMPCYNAGDLADHLTLRRWVKAMRRQQLALDAPYDLLLLIDMDADDEFWVGFGPSFLRRLFSTAGGLEELVESIADLDYVEFTTPGVYIEAHQPLKTISIGQDTADGSFDGLSSWAEKWSNQRIWSGLERARILELQTWRLAGQNLPAESQSFLQESFEARLKLLSTTHFGMASPVINLTREQAAAGLAQQAVNTARQAFDQVRLTPEQNTFSLIDYARGVSTPLVEYPARPSRALVRLALRESAPERLTLKNSRGQVIPAAILQTGTARELLFVENFQPEERKDYSLEPGEPPSTGPAPVAVSETSLGNEHLKITFDARGQVIGFQFNGAEYAAGRFLNSVITYAGRGCSVEKWEIEAAFAAGAIAFNRMRGAAALENGEAAHFEREMLLAAGLPYVYIRMQVDYPLTPHRGYDRVKAQRLEQSWDNRWQEVRPCEVHPALAGTPDSPLRVWKHNYCDHISTFSLDYGRFSANHELDSVNNQVTHGWSAVSDGRRGILVAQTADSLSSMAFCPLRTCKHGESTQVLLNPFGTYTGKQYRYATADTGLGNWLATSASASDHLKPYAPSFNGRRQEFSLLVAPYAGDAPPEALQWDAEAFAYPYLVLNDETCIAEPTHRSWNSTGLGKTSSGNHL